jgi:hypothetical protein
MATKKVLKKANTKVAKKEVHKAKVKKAKNIDGNVQRRKVAKDAAKRTKPVEQLAETDMNENDETIDELDESDFFADEELSDETFNEEEL